MSEQSWIVVRARTHATDTNTFRKTASIHKVSNARYKTVSEKAIFVLSERQSIYFNSILSLTLT